jgi:hypothetical protein
MRKYTITAKHYNWLPDHGYVLVTFDVLAYNTKDAREIGERRCTQWELIFVTAKRK